ncbi:MAG: GNAT family N-acetyltransferase [Actinomycetota bacterium]|nr:GNAT family N-acetyltransferase [Actinomycetota bacterium]MDQ2958273.1 GNAT family N-acetyltransferase [Actinomycetota bacterium]
MTVEWGVLSLDQLIAWAELTNLLAKVDETQEFYEAADLAEELVEPGVDPNLDTVAVWQDGTLAGFGQLRVSEGLTEGKVRASLGGGVHPDYRGRGLGTEIMNRLESRARELSAQRHPGIEVLLRVSGGIEGASVRPLLHHRGYRIVRYFHEMERELPGVLPSAPAPAIVQPYTADLSEAVRLAHQDAFSSHWGSTPWNAEQWQGFAESRTLRPAACTVSLGSDGAVDSFVMIRQWVDGEAWIDVVGTRQRARGKGLARACLSASLRAAAEQGFRTAALGVDSENAQGAGALYSSLGFQVARVVASYSREVPPL